MGERVSRVYRLKIADDQFINESTFTNAARIIMNNMMEIIRFLQNNLKNLPKIKLGIIKIATMTEKKMIEMVEDAKQQFYQDASVKITKEERAQLMWGVGYIATCIILFIHKAFDKIMKVLGNFIDSISVCGGLTYRGDDVDEETKLVEVQQSGLPLQSSMILQVRNYVSG